MRVTGIILAAGQGTRMRSDLPKVLHPLGGRPLMEYSVCSVRNITESKPVVIVGHCAQEVRNLLRESVEYVYQDPQLGTGHAVQQAEKFLRGLVDTVLVVTADMPLLTDQTLKRLLDLHLEKKSALTLLTTISYDSYGFGRILRDPAGKVYEIVEEAHATPEQLKITELNASVYCFDANWLWEALPRIPISAKGEYYLTDLIGIAVKDDLPVEAVICEDSQETLGINTRAHLAEAEAIMRKRINMEWMLAGVTIVDPMTTYIDRDAIIGRDTVIHPNTFLRGKTQIGAGCNIGPNTIIQDTQIGDRCQVISSTLEMAIVENNVDIGPYAHLRKGAHLAEGVHMGNFGEVKNSYLGQGTKMGHFSYMGDATLGPGVNIGAGTITCNFDGESKHPTEIGEGAFIGSDTMLVAPIKVGARSRTGAGSVVTKDVPPDTVVVGIPARGIRKAKTSD